LLLSFPNNPKNPKNSSNPINPTLDLSFVILTWNSEKYIKGCLQSLIDDLKGSLFSYEIFLIDNGSQDGTRRIIKAFKDLHPLNIKPIYLKCNKGTTFSRNLALRQAKGRYLLIMDSDIEVSPGVTQSLVDTLESDSRIGIVVPKLVYPNGKLQKSTDVFPTVFTKAYRYFFLKMLEENEAKNFSGIGITEIDYAISAVWAFRNELLETVGFLDENIFYAPEDLDYCLRTWKDGYRILYNSDVSCIHHTQEISRGFRFNRAFFSHVCGLAYYFKKHRYFLKKPLVRTDSYI